MVGTDHKYCAMCEQVKPLTDYYYKNSGNGNKGYTSWCKPCYIKKQLEYNANKKRRDSE